MNLVYNEEIKSHDLHNIRQYSSDKFFTNLLMQLNKEVACKIKCGKCFKKTALFESVPFWLVKELYVL